MERFVRSCPGEAVGRALQIVVGQMIFRNYKVPNYLPYAILFTWMGAGVALAPMFMKWWIQKRSSNN